MLSMAAVLQVHLVDHLDKMGSTLTDKDDANLYKGTDLSLWLMKFTGQV